MAEPKTKPTGASVEAFLNTVEAPGRRAEGFAVLELLSQLTGAEAEMWGPSIVGFGRYGATDARGKVTDWPRIGFSPRKADLVIYLMPGGANRPDLLARLGKHRLGASCLYLKRLNDADPAVLRELVAWAWETMQARYPGA
jgi:hypothetical protein